MGKCYFSGLDAKITTLSSYDGFSCRTEEFGEFWMSRSLHACYSGDHELSDYEKKLCLTEIVKLNRKGLIPFWVQNRNEEKIDQNKRVVLRTIKEIIEAEVNDEEKETDLLQVLFDKSQAIKGTTFPYLNISRSDRFFIHIYEDDDFLLWFKRLIEDELIDLNDEAAALFNEIDHPMMRVEFVNSISEYQMVRMTPQGMNELKSRKGKQVNQTGELFWSWQSHYRNSSDKIKKAIEFSVDQINNGGFLKTPLTIQKAMRPEDGAVRIDETIPEKIKKVRYFIADVTPIWAWENKDKNRKVNYPNPNIAIEVGYALEALDPTQIFLIAQERTEEEFKFANMPFDISTRALHTYKDEQDINLIVLHALATSLRVHGDISPQDFDKLIEDAKG